jgi:hypothetical protein
MRTDVEKMTGYGIAMQVVGKRLVLTFSRYGR